MDWSSFSIGNAAGFVKGPGKAFDDLLRSPVTDITIGSITCEPRPGNSGNTYYLLEDGTSVNALGLPNPGAGAFKQDAKDMASQAQAAGKTLRWSVAGFSIDEYVQLVDAFYECGRLELNLGCPNVWGDAGQKPIASFNIDLMEAIITEIGRRYPFFFDIKVSPYSDPAMIPRLVEVIQKNELYVSSIVTCNTFPNGIAHDGERRVLDTPDGFGGVAGNALFPVALGQVAQFNNAIGGEWPRVIGVGGISTGTHVRAMRDAGASGIQVGTAYGEQGARVFSHILEELARA